MKSRNVYSPSLATSDFANKYALYLFVRRGAASFETCLMRLRILAFGTLKRDAMRAASSSWRWCSATISALILRRVSADFKADAERSANVVLLTRVRLVLRFGCEARARALITRLALLIAIGRCGMDAGWMRDDNR